MPSFAGSCVITPFSAPTSYVNLHDALKVDYIVFEKLLNLALVPRIVPETVYAAKALYDCVDSFSDLSGIGNITRVRLEIKVCSIETAALLSTDSVGATRLHTQAATTLDSYLHVQVPSEAPETFP